MVENDRPKIISINLSAEIDANAPIADIFSDAHSCEDTSCITEILPQKSTLSFDGNLFVELIISFSVGVASGVVGNYIYNALHNAKTKKLIINGRRTRLTEESITQAIETIKEMLKEQGEAANKQ